MSRTHLNLNIYLAPGMPGAIYLPDQMIGIRIIPRTIPARGVINFVIFVPIGDSHTGRILSAMNIADSRLQLVDTGKPQSEADTTLDDLPVRAIENSSTGAEA